MIGVLLWQFDWRYVLVTLVTVVVAAVLLFMAPPLSMFLVFAGYVLFGLARAAVPRRAVASEPAPRYYLGTTTTTSPDGATAMPYGSFKFPAAPPRAPAGDESTHR